MIPATIPRWSRFDTLIPVLIPASSFWLLCNYFTLPLRAECGLNHDIALLSRQIELPHQDPADRFIAASAIFYELTLATVDQNLVSCSWLPTMS
jgi:hypothetical protein